MDNQENTDSGINSDESASAVANETHTENAAEGQQETNGHEQRPGYLDFRNATPEQIEAKFNDLYGQTKQSKRAAQEARGYIDQYKTIAEQQAALIADLTSNQHTIVNHLEQKSYVEAETTLRQQAKAAFEAGDTNTYLEVQEKLLDIKTQKALQAQQQKAQPKQQPQQKNNFPSATQMARESEADGDISPQDAQVIGAWQGETDDSGKELRPWATNRGTGDNPDPDYARAFFTAQSVFTKPEYERLSMQQKLAKVDELMGVKKSTPSQAVMGGGLTKRGSASKITLSPEAEKFVVRTKFGGSKFKTDAERIDAYKRQLADNKQGARK